MVSIAPQNNIAKENLLNLCQTMPSQELVDTLTDAVRQRPEIRQFLMVKLIKLVSKGVNYSETVSTAKGADPDREDTFSIYRWNRPTGGAASVIIAKDERGVPHMAFVKKYNEANWHLPAGFMDPRPAGEMSADKVYDKDLQDTAAREAREETGLNIDKQAFQQIAHWTYSNENFQQLVNGYKVDLGFQKNGLPALRTTDIREIEATKWIPLSAISHDGKVTLNGVTNTIFPEYVGVINKALEEQKKDEAKAPKGWVERIKLAGQVIIGKNIYAGI